MFPRFHALRQHNTQHGFPIRIKTIDLDDIFNKIYDPILTKEELRSCQRFYVDFELEKARRKLFNYAAENLIETIVNEKLDHFFNNLQCAPKVNLAFRLILKIYNMEDSDTFTHTITITCWIDPKFCAPKMIWQRDRIFASKLTSSCLVIEKE